jgi:hypothetical protein
MTTLSKKAEKALELMKEGAYWRHALESGWHGEKFETRLRLGGTVVKGFGFEARIEMELAALLVSKSVPKGSTWASEWVLKTEAV